MYKLRFFAIHVLLIASDCLNAGLMPKLDTVHTDPHKKTSKATAKYTTLRMYTVCSPGAQFSLFVR